VVQAPFAGRRKYEETLLQRLFPAFPGGWPGIALLLLRAVLAVALLEQGRFYLQGADGAKVNWLIGLSALASGALLLIGFLTPIAGAVAGLGTVALGFSLLPPCTPTIFDSKPAVVFAVAILLGIVVLGPGAFSLDARMFGRREIIIPPAGPSYR
jgi:uncharacterized membrane protein YphA (DoxX/SURF4 family)